MRAAPTPICLAAPIGYAAGHINPRIYGHAEAGVIEAAARTRVESYGYSAAQAAVAIFLLP
jgi:hypothetical protein